MEKNQDFLSSYISDLYSKKSAEDRFRVYEKYILSLGFSGATYTLATRMQLEAMNNLPLMFFHTTDYPVGFLEEYERERYDEIDFAKNKTLKTGKTEPMDWREHELSGELSEGEIFLIQRARDKYNIKNAISIPTMLDETGAAGVSIISTRDDQEFSVLKSKALHLLIPITRLFHESNVSDLGKFISPIFKELSDKEIAILNYKASGKPMKNIHDHTGLKYSYSTNVLSKLMTRLGNVNSDRLMYLFGLLNCLNDIPNLKPPRS